MGGVFTLNSASWALSESMLGSNTSGDKRSIGLAMADGRLYKGTSQAESCINQSSRECAGLCELGGGEDLKKKGVGCISDPLI